MSPDRLRRRIFAGCKALRLDTEMRRDLQLAATGKESLGQMDAADMEKVLAALQARGFRATGRRKAAPRADLRYVHVLWRILGQAGRLDRPGRDGLNAFLRARFGAAWGAVPADIDMLRDPAQIEAVICALTTWCRREGLSLARDQPATGRSPA